LYPDFFLSLFKARLNPPTLYTHCRRSSYIIYGIAPITTAATHVTVFYTFCEFVALNEYLLLDPTFFLPALHPLFPTFNRGKINLQIAYQTPVCVRGDKKEGENPLDVEL
jgi:hypothetical protein